MDGATRQAVLLGQYPDNGLWVWSLFMVFLEDRICGGEARSLTSVRSCVR
jgi:hypothetical protein